MSSNLGATSLKRRNRPGCAMQAFDALPAPVRHWLAEAALPWSPASARRLWQRAKRQGLSLEEALHILTATEARMLARDAQALKPQDVPRPTS